MTIGAASNPLKQHSVTVDANPNVSYKTESTRKVHTPQSWHAAGLHRSTTTIGTNNDCKGPPNGRKEVPMCKGTKASLEQLGRGSTLTRPNGEIDGVDQELIQDERG